MCVGPRGDTSELRELVRSSLLTGRGYARLHMGRAHTYAGE